MIILHELNSQDVKRKVVSQRCFDDIPESTGVMESATGLLKSTTRGVEGITRNTPPREFILLILLDLICLISVGSESERDI